MYLPARLESYKHAEIVETMVGCAIFMSKQNVSYREFIITIIVSFKQNPNSSFPIFEHFLKVL